MHRALLKYRVRQVLSALNLRVRPGGRPHKDLRALLAHISRVGFNPSTVIVPYATKRGSGLAFSQLEQLPMRRHSGATTAADSSETTGSHGPLS